MDRCDIARRSAARLNIPAVKVLLDAGGPAALHERLRAVGLTTLDKPAEIYGLGLTLGNCEARLLEITNAYASLARLGEYKPWRVVADGVASPGGHRYSRPELVWQIADIMSDNSARTLAFGINSALRYNYPVACKTGTSTDFRDNWTIGFTPEFSVGVWVGNFDGAADARSLGRDRRRADPARHLRSSACHARHDLVSNAAEHGGAEHPSADRKVAGG